MKPPYELTSEILELITNISLKLGEVNASSVSQPRTELRRENRIRTIHSSLQIEGNTLSLDQVSTVLDGKRISGPEKDIMEVKNAILVYEEFESLKYNRKTDFLKAHRILMKGLIEGNGKYRQTGVGIAKGNKLTHVAPKADMVHGLMNDLFLYLKNDCDPALIKSFVFHYEMQFIHPFTDGNGRMGRLWQSLILANWNPIFKYLPVEAMVKIHQRDYYGSLATSDGLGQSTPFIIFMLRMIDNSLAELLMSQRKPLSWTDRIRGYRETAGEQSFTRKQYLEKFKNISTATASRDLKQAVDQDILIKLGSHNATTYRFKG